ncbi:polysaccharide deacetylase family protein [Gracilinema caldarium]|uniref:Polysaccharide deacetylase n=1 Tax=Gracilinema caldarium (strain ATCC 51460 / DSM 7334 / H1) TaxID=744872 RepID=F8F1N6_GRAC1|nr:polysaccharide deacetylase family protein [Gracilinema caldarium]AEJ19370.1 polysaccharide deacetylase [Gracilinema caldarium DSM 7334]
MNHYRKIATIITIISIFLKSALFAEVRFEGLDLFPDSRLLYTVQVSNPGSIPHSGLFISDLEKNKTKLLTLFPEKIELLDEGRIVQVRNSFGAFRFPIKGGLPSSVMGFPTFPEGAPIQSGRIEAMSASYDGKWVLYVEPISAAYGNLVLIDVGTGKRIPIATRVERPGRQFPAVWSKDSQVLIYVKEGKLYYYALSSLQSVPVDEQFRLIGNGQIHSVYWGPQGDFFYINGRTIYKVRSSELFARSLYANFLEIGQVAGILPFTYEPAFDRFWIHPASKAILVSKAGQILFFFPLTTQGNQTSNTFEQSSIYPYLTLPVLCSDIRVLWSSSGVITLWGLRSDNGALAFSYRLDASQDTGPYSFVPIKLPAISEALLSPDGTKAVLWGEGGCYIYTYLDWKAVTTVSKNPTLSVQWITNDEVIVGDHQFIYKLKQPDNRTILNLSKADSYAFETATGLIVTKVNEVWFSTDGTSPWSLRTDKVSLRTPMLSSDRFRVYLEPQGGGLYTNIPMVRSLAALTTQPLILVDGTQYESISEVPGKDTSTSFSNVFNNGKRYGTRTLSITFDVMDSFEGLTTVLDILKQYNIRATFFVNGEFIRRYGDMARLLSTSGHEIASLFYAPIDLSDTRYRVDTHFIKRGLARNEDEYLNATGKELSSFWHAPYYIISPEIVSAASSAGYKTIGRDLDPFDWVGKSDMRRSYVPYLTASDIVDQIMQKKRPGSIIPIRIGANENTRTDYLFNRLDVLLDALLRAGYEIVPVSTLLEQAK